MQQKELPTFRDEEWGRKRRKFFHIAWIPHAHTAFALKHAHACRISCLSFDEILVMPPPPSLFPQPSPPLPLPSFAAEHGQKGRGLTGSPAAPLWRPQLGSGLGRG